MYPMKLSTFILPSQSLYLAAFRGLLQSFTGEFQENKEPIQTGHDKLLPHNYLFIFKNFISYIIWFSS
jgi:hypothetical protein